MGFHYQSIIPPYERTAEVCRRLLMGGAVHSFDTHVWAAWLPSGVIKVNTSRHELEYHANVYEAARALVLAELRSIRWAAKEENELDPIA